MANYRDFDFGFASAEMESAHRPQLLVEGFLDPADWIAQTRDGHRFLVLGYKGSGKSAIAEHLRLEANGTAEMFVEVVNLSDFPFSDFAKIIGGDSEPEARYPTAWGWLLLIKLFGSLANDEGVSLDGSTEISAALRALKSMGFLPVPELKKVAAISSKAAFKLQIPMVFEGTIQRDMSDSEARIPLFTERLAQIACSNRGSARHILVIDGLDDILTKREVQYQSLAALTLEVSRLNLVFQRARAKLKIVLLCRTDLYERLPGANKNKTRQDAAVVLDWYHDPRNIDESHLLKLATRRAQLSVPEINDLIEQYFPTGLDPRQQSTKVFLLEHTRHTPRDFLQLLTHVQMFSTGPGKLTRAQVLSGLREYSINYFLPEIKDELVGYIPEEQLDPAIGLIGSLRKREFTFSELQQKAAAYTAFRDIDLHALLRALFECSAAGNVQTRRRTTYFTFRFRNRNSALSLDDRIILHRGMWKSMNLI
jgi:hypothetical protein